MSKEIDWQFERCLVIIKLYQIEIGKLYFLLNDYISEETDNLTKSVKEYLSDCKIDDDDLI